MASGSQFAQYINPLLAVLKRLGGSARAAEAKAAVAEHLRLGDEALEDRLASGSSRYENQVSWARYYLVRAGYIDSSRRGVWALTEKGHNAQQLTDAEINRLVKHVIFEWGSRDAEDNEPLAAPSEARPPDESARSDHRTQLLSTILGLPASGFERLCQRLLREAGFEQVTVTGRSGDGGIDGIGILELNAFASFRVVFQCKKYEGSVGSAAVRDFRGAMQGRAEKGLILTTGSFSADAKREALRDGVPPIELVDGERLLVLFEQLELGLTPRKTYDVKPGFFDEFRA
jgi:restriction system protein